MPLLYYSLKNPPQQERHTTKNIRHEGNIPVSFSRGSPADRSSAALSSGVQGHGSTPVSCPISSASGSAWGSLRHSHRGCSGLPVLVGAFFNPEKRSL